MGSTAEIRSVIDRWCEAFVTSDVEGIVKMYSPDAAFLGTSNPRMVGTPSEVRTYFDRAIRERTPKSAEVLDFHLQDYGSMVIVTTLDRIEWSDSESPQISMGRVTFVLRQENSGWRIVCFHRSEVPLKR